MPALDFKGKSFICTPGLDGNFILHGDNLEALKAPAIKIPALRAGSGTTGHTRFSHPLTAMKSIGCAR